MMEMKGKTTMNDGDEKVTVWVEAPWSKSFLNQETLVIPHDLNNLDKDQFIKKVWTKENGEN